MQAGPARTEREGRGDALLLRDTDAADAEAQPLEVLALTWSWWSPASRREEEEPGSLLVRMPEGTTVRIGARHPATLDTPAASCLINPGNDN